MNRQEKEKTDQEFDRILVIIKKKYRTEGSEGGPFTIKRKGVFFWSTITRIANFDTDEALRFPTMAHAFAYISLLEGGDRDLLKNIYKLGEGDWPRLYAAVEEEKCMA